MEIIEEGNDRNNVVKNKLDEKPKCSETTHQSVVKRRILALFRDNKILKIWVYG